MRATGLRRTAGVFVGAAIVAGAVWVAWPQPIPVDLATVAREPMEVTIEDEGRTRVRHVYTVSAPVSGTVLRTPRHVGDAVEADETVVAVMRAAVPGFLDLRSRQELEAALQGAEAAVELAEHEVHRIEAALEFSSAELQRTQALAERGTVSPRTLQQAEFEVETNRAALGSAKAQLAARRSEHAAVAARLIDPAELDGTLGATCCIELKAPVSGRVLRLVQESEAVVQAGTPLIEIGDPGDLEVIVDLLTSEAVRIDVGADVRIDGWGGPPIRGRVVRIDPAGFTKLSALGIDEQRVHTIIDLADPPETWSRLGHDFRVIVDITAWRSDNALTVPVAALFRADEHWAVYRVENSQARATRITIGQRNSRVAEVLDGLSEGDEVVLHASDRVGDGSRVSARQTY